MKFDEATPLFGDLTKAVTSHKKGCICDVAHGADLIVVGAPCNHYSPINMHSRKPWSILPLLDSILTIMQRTECTALLIENVPDITTAANGAIYNTRLTKLMALITLHSRATKILERQVLRSLAT